MNIIGIIPARMASTRYPGKPLKLICGVPLVGHVYFRTKMCSLLTDVCVATCDKEIYDYVSRIGGMAIMTGNHHERCSDRTAEALQIMEKDTGKRYDIVVMVQGDEPMVTPQMIERSILPMIEDASINVVNLAENIQTLEGFEDPNEVKVVVDTHQNALYYSREPIPSRKKGTMNVPMLKQVCVIPFRRDYLLRFNAMASTPLEQIESIDMMRILENGEKVKIIKIDDVTYSVDTQEDLRQVESVMKDDKLMGQYLKGH